MYRVILLSVVLFAALSAAPPSRASRGPYIKGRTIYRKGLWRCAMWWHRLGDISKSSGKRVSRSTPLYVELAKLSEAQFHVWLADPMHHHPKVNCRPGPFGTKREVALLRHFIVRKAFNPPKKPQIIRQPLKRSKIRLVKTQKLIRQRLETLKRIRKWLPHYKNTTTHRAKSRSRL